MSRILITGGSGFIGTHLAAAYLARGDEVSNIDVKAPPLPGHAPHWTRLDILDAEGLQRHVAAFRPDIVFNLAAVADISLSAEAFKANTTGLENLLRAGEALADAPRVVHTSTQLVVGPDYDSKGPRDYHPYTPYGESKAESEEILWRWTGRGVWTIVRPATVWGPWHPSLGTSTWRYLNRRWYMVPTRKDCIRTYSYVANLVDQLVAAAEADPALVDRKVFYGGDDPVPSSRWLDAFSLELTGRPTRRVPYALLDALAWLGEASGRIGAPSPINRGRLYRMTTDYPVPVEAAHKILGTGRVSLEQGVKETAAWLRAAYPEEYGAAR